MGGRVAAQLALVVGRADTAPSRTTTQPTGTSSWAAASAASLRASLMKCSSRGSTPRMAGRYPQPVRIASVNVGLPSALEFDGRSVVSGIVKAPVAGPTMVRATNLDGDRQADLRVHGGPDKAVYAYPIQHYDPLDRPPRAASSRRTATSART